jgi:hypothetical protein
LPNFEPEAGVKEMVKKKGCLSKPQARTPGKIELPEEFLAIPEDMQAGRPPHLASSSK